MCVMFSFASFFYTQFENSSDVIPIVINMNRSRLLLSVKSIVLSLYLRTFWPIFSPRSKLIGKFRFLSLKMLREKRMLKMMEKKNNEKCEFIDRTAWFTRLRSEVLLVLI